jgi:glutamate-1-semialdehyde 2,1-aminomutase
MALPVRSCSRCEESEEPFDYLHGLYRFDLAQARALVTDGRELVEVDDESIRASIADHEIDAEHLDHIEPTCPGIIAHVQSRSASGELLTGHVLIDGHHRAARCLREQRPFLAYLLTENESLAFRTRQDESTSAGKAAPCSDKPAETPEVGVAEEMAAYEQAFAGSAPLYRRAQAVIAGATTHDRRDFGPFPVYVERAEGPYKWDVQGRRLIDYWTGHGALLFGHSFRPVVDAVARQVACGTHYGACHEAEVRWAELVCELVPSAERVRFTSSGTEATQLALRSARAYTGRERIVKLAGHFHGWHDEAMVHFYDHEEAGFSAGALKSVAVAGGKSIEEEVKALLREENVAAVILEPGGGSAGGMPCGREFLQFLRQATRTHGTLLIFDEVITGFRAAPGGVQEQTGILPDLTTLAKILAGGLPGGAVVGRADVMAVFGSGTRRDQPRTRFARAPHTGTFNGNPLSAAAGIAMLERVADGVAQERARKAAARLVEQVNQAAEANRVDVFLYTNDSSIYHVLIGARAAGWALGPSYAVAALSAANPGRYARLRRALLMEGVDAHHIHGWVSAVHEDDVIDATTAAFDRAFTRLRSADGFRM